MKKTIWHCDRCAKETEGQHIRIVTYPIQAGSRHTAELCNECYLDFIRWIKNEGQFSAEMK